MLLSIKPFTSLAYINSHFEHFEASKNIIYVRLKNKTIVNSIGIKFVKRESFTSMGLSSHCNCHSTERHLLRKLNVGRFSSENRLVLWWHVINEQVNSSQLAEAFRPVPHGTHIYHSCWPHNEDHKLITAHVVSQQVSPTLYTFTYGFGAFIFRMSKKFLLDWLMQMWDDKNYVQRNDIFNSCRRRSVFN